MDQKTKRKILMEHATACKEIEMTELAIMILERVSGCNSIIKMLLLKQQTQLRKIDKAAEKLGVPYS